MAENSILIIEDDEDLNRLLEYKLKQNKYVVYKAFNGKEGFKLAKSKLPDLILLDIVMPIMNGFEVLEKLKKNKKTKNIKVYILSNLGQPEEIEKGLELGVDRYFIKAHLSLEDVVKMVKKDLN